MHIKLFLQQVPQQLKRNTCGAFHGGFNFFFHQPNELIPLQSDHRYIVPYNSYYTVAITTKTYYAKEEIRRYPPFTRKCFFQGERSLKFFKQYNEKMCM